jgi:hypothetical protein
MSEDSYVTARTLPPDELAEYASERRQEAEKKEKQLARKSAVLKAELDGVKKDLKAAKADIQAHKEHEKLGLDSMRAEFVANPYYKPSVDDDDDEDEDLENEYEDEDDEEDEDEGYATVTHGGRSASSSYGKAAAQKWKKSNRQKRGAGGSFKSGRSSGGYSAPSSRSKRFDMNDA